jgi:hypothetical protein
MRRKFHAQARARRPGFRERELSGMREREIEFCDFRVRSNAESEPLSVAIK